MRLIINLIVCIALGLFAWLSGSKLAAEVRSYPTVASAVAIEASRRIPQLSSASIERIRNRLDAKAGCSMSAVRAGVTLSVALAEIEFRRAASIEQRSSAYNEARDRVVGALRCAPTDGNLWNVLAFVEGRIGFQQARLLDVIAMSARMAPADGRVLGQRWFLLGSMTGLPEMALPPMLRGDLNRALIAVKVPIAIDILATLCNANGDSTVRQALETLPQLRVAELETAASGTHSDFGRTTRYRVLDFDPFGAEKGRRSRLGKSEANEAEALPGSAEKLIVSACSTDRRRQDHSD